MKRRWLLSIALALIVGGVAGWGAASVSTPGAGTSLPVVGIGGGPQEQPLNSAFNTKSTNLRIELNNLLKEHGVLASSYLQKVYDGKDISRDEQLINANSDGIVSIIQSIYGNNTRDELSALWRQHIDEYRNYALAQKSNDTTRMNETREDLNNISQRMGELFDKTTNTLSSSTISALMKEHVNGTLELIDAHAAGDEDRKAGLMKDAYDQAGRFADTLAQGIINDKQDMFK